MKYSKLFFIALIFILIIPKIIFAGDKQALDDVSLRIVIPSETESETLNKKETVKTIPKIYPVNVYESSENGINQIIKTYELSAGESAEDIPRDSFQQGDFIFELTDITKKNTSSTDIKEFKKTVSINTATNDLGTVISKFAPTIEYKSDGYTGTLSLNTRNIQIKTAGTKNESYTISSVKEYPNLSNNDPALVPKTITDKGTTMNLSRIDWKTSSSSAIDYQELPENYTAIASYTATAYKIVATGYIATGEYKGSISKTTAGKTIYTAVFKGTKVLQPETEKQRIEAFIENVSISDDVKGGDAEKINSSVIFKILFFVIVGIIILGFVIKKKYDERKNQITENTNSEISKNNEKGGSKV